MTQVATYKPKAAEYKKRIVDRYARLISDSKVIAIVNMANLPAPQLQSLRAQLREQANLSMSKRRLMSLALKQAETSKKGVAGLIEKLEGMPAFIFTDMNPFKLASFLNENKSKAPAKPGQIAPDDIIVSAGPTSFPPGPIISELNQAGLKTKIEEGKIVIKEEFVAARKGEEIEAKVAGILAKLGVKPIDIGLELVAVYEDGIIYDRDILSIDKSEYVQQVTNAYAESIALATYVGYFTAETIAILLLKADAEAKSLAQTASIVTSDTAKTMLALAERQMTSLKSQIDKNQEE